MADVMISNRRGCLGTVIPAILEAHIQQSLDNLSESEPVRGNHYGKFSLLARLLEDGREGTHGGAGGERAGHQGAQDGKA